MINYYLITKPGIIMGNLITYAAGFFLAAKGLGQGMLFVITLLGLGFIMASACVFNNYIDRNLDKKMHRTKNRALAKGLISERKALIFGVILGVIGNGLLFAYTNTLTLFVADIGFFIYVVIYSMWKSRTIYGTAIGSLAGAVPPVVGYCAVSNQFDLGALILFSMMVLWQMPHFFSIAIYRFNDYKAGGIPVLPVIKGMLRTKIHSVIYIVLFLIVGSLLTLFHYTGTIYLVAFLILNMVWLLLALQGFRIKNEALWGRQMFIFSLVLITIISVIIPFDTV
ncbi:MAG: heme o synthase [Chlamydiae bacterium]|nr:heme o synthase [Chlamydiota bacterium]